MSHFTRVVRSAFIASFLRDMGVSQLKVPEEEKKESSSQDKDTQMEVMRPPFVVCIDEIIKKQALTHAIFTRALRVMSGPIHEVYLRGNLVDIGRENYDSRFERKLVAPEGFPNSYVKGASGLYLRVGVHVEAADGGAQSTSAAGSPMHTCPGPVMGVTWSAVPKSEGVMPSWGVRYWTVPSSPLQGCDCHTTMRDVHSNSCRLNARG